jgi:hypothetical protein
MTRFAILFAILGVSACSPGTEPDAPSDIQADVVLTVPGMASYIGVWESEDAQLRQAFVIAEGGAAVDACMRAPDENGVWRIVSQGRYVAEGDEIRGSFTGEDMGFERLDVVGYPIGRDGEVDWVNTAVTPQGEMVTYETWSPPSGGVFTYVIERGEGVERELWFSGQWRFRNDLEAECE